METNIETKQGEPFLLRTSSSGGDAGVPESHLQGGGRCQVLESLV